mgnify:CR=1 FL=1
MTGLAKTRGPYCLGLPAWAFPGWKGRYFHDGSTLLHDYASVFNTVEGNTTFYAVPSATTVDRWAEQAPPEFRFAFKAPRAVTHERRLRPGAHPALAELQLRHAQEVVGQGQVGRCLHRLAQSPPRGLVVAEALQQPVGVLSQRGHPGGRR